MRIEEHDVNQKDSETHLRQLPRIGRRALLIGSASMLGIATALGWLGLGNRGALVTPAQAQFKRDRTEIPMDELMQKGPLEDRAIGSPDAPVVIIEYASATCPHCARFHNETWPALKERYVDTGKVYFIFRDFPLDSYAAAASMLARCVDKEKYFPFVKALFAQQEQWAFVRPSQRVEALFNFAKQAGFTRKKFEDCLRDQKLLDGINWMRTRAAREFGVNSTPTFFINGKLLRGRADIETFEEIIKPYLNSRS